jgi:alkylation response protein AidB-like acyl-CoA dehydrogenase
MTPLPVDPGVRHIPLPEYTDWYAPDEHLRWLVRARVGEALWPVAESALAEAGQIVPQRIEPLAQTAERHPPVLRQFDPRGARIDEIEFHPAYLQLMEIPLRFGLVRAGHIPGWRGLARPAPRTLVTALNYLWMQADQSVNGCPVGMMDAMVRALRRNDAGLAERFVPRLCDDTGNHLTAAMFLTEKAGGSDVGANETTAVRQDDGTWRLFGEKWFASCAHSDLILVMARPEGAGPGTRGLGLFLVPRHLEDGSRNAFVIHRLKEKFGTRAMPSAELGFRGAFAWQVGALDRGMKQMLDMVNLTRVGIAAQSAAVMRRSASESLAHAAERQTFGQRLDTHPLMRDTLAELVVDATASLTTALGVAEMLDRADAGDATAGNVLRLLTPMAKMAGSERARISATEAMEARGGNGAIEDWPNSRVLRDAYIHSIWEGTGNIMALDVLRALAHGAGPDWLGDVERRAEAAAGTGPAAPLATVVLGELRRLEGDLASLASADPDGQQLRVRRLARRMALLAAGARLSEQASQHAADAGSGRLVWLTARYVARLGGERAVAAVADDSRWFAHADALLRGGHVPVAVGEAAAQATAAALGGVPAPVG